MSQNPQPWRSSAPAPGAVPPLRYVAFGLLALVAVALTLIAMGTLSLRTPARASAILLRVGQLPWRAADHAAIGALFARSRTASGLDQAALLREVKGATEVLVYLSAPARRDDKGRLCVLAADADPDDAATWLPVDRIEELLGPRRLLVLDLDGGHLEPRSGPTLYAAGDGQETLWTENHGRSAFGLYVEMGLSGFADADGNGQVTGRELAAYVRDRVDRWARLVRGVRQVPEFAGAGADFAIVEVATPRRPEMPEPRAYPKDASPEAERAWREGHDDAGQTKKANAGSVPPIRSLARLGPAPREAVDAVRFLTAQLTAKLRTAAVDKADAVRSMAVEAFLKEHKPTPGLLAALVEVVTDDPLTLPHVRAVLAVAEPDAAFVETLAVGRLAAMAYPPTLFKRAMEAVSDLERAVAEPRGFAATRAEAERAAQVLHEAFVALEARGYAAPAEVGRKLAEAHDAATKLAARRVAERDANTVLDRARALLPDSRAYLVRTGRDPATWLAAVEALRTQQPLERTLVALEEPFTTDGVARRVRDAKRGDAPGPWRELDGLLASGRVRERAAVWETMRDLGRRLEDEVARQDERDGTKLNGVPPVEPTAALPSLSVLAVAGDEALWAWLADRYRYEAREQVALAPDGPAAAFFTRAAAEYRPWLDAPRETFAELTAANDPTKLLPGEPAALKVEARSVPPRRVSVEFLAPDDEWIAVEPRKRDTDGGVVTVQLSLRETAGTGLAPPPLGLLARTAVNERTFHRKIDVPLSPRVPEVVFAPVDAKPGAASSRLALRAVPGRQPIALHLSNPIDRTWKKLVVRVSAGGAVRESLPLTLGPRETKRVLFAPGAVPPAGPLPDIRTVTVSVTDDAADVVTRTLAVGLSPPGDYVRVTAAGFNPSTGRLEVRLRQRATLPGPGVTAEMTLPPPEEGGLAYKTGTLRGKLPPGGEELALFADGVTGEGTARFAVGVDGWPRAFAFRVTLARRGGAALPDVVTAANIRARLSPFAIAGAKFAVPLEVDAAPPGAIVEVALGRNSGGAFAAEQSARRDGGRDDRVGFALSGSDLLFEAATADWTVPLDVSRIRGSRTLVARLVTGDGRELARDERPVVLGDQPPEGVRFVNAPARAWNKAALPLVAAAADGVVGVKEVFFFVGRPVMDKMPEGAMKVAAEARAGGTWAAKVPMPADRKGAIEVSVGAVNAVGLTAFATVSVELSDEDPEKTKPASVRGTVVEGERPQPGVEVVLLDEKGAEKGRTKTNEDGAYAFKDVAPGKYRLTAAKGRTGRKAAYPRGGGTFEVMPGAAVTAELVLFL